MATPLSARTATSLLVLGLWIGPLSAQPLAELIPAGISAGLVVRLGTTDGEQEAAWARNDSWVVLGLALNPSDGAKARAYLADKGLLGRATVLDVVDGRRLPLVSNSAALLVADLDQLGDRAPDMKELLRVLRPLGSLRVKKDGKWQTQTRPWPKELDDWPMHFHDAAGTDVSRDTTVGPPRGLQWHTGDAATDNKFGLRTRNGTILSVEDDPTVAGRRQKQRLVARDAFTGIKLWERTGLALTNRYLMLVDERHLYLHNDGDRYMAVLDLATGRDVRKLNEGLDLSGTNYHAVQQRAELWPEAVLHQGLLVQVGRGKIVVLDASGKRKWSKDLGPGLAQFPTVVDDQALAVVEGPRAIRSPAYLPGWNSCQLEAVVFYDLSTGREVRRWQPRLEVPQFVLHMGAAEGSLALVAGVTRSGNKEKDETRVYCLDPASATLRWSKVPIELGKSGLGGHGTNLRVLIQKGRLWCTGLRAAVGYALKDGTDALKVDYVVSQCQPTRATLNYQFSALCALRVEDNKLLRNEASRPACDIGPFPSNGLLYTTATNCGCHPFLSGFNAFHPEPPPVAWPGERLQPGPAQPADAPAGDWPARDAWPMYMRNPQRSNWTDAPLPADKLTAAWKLKVPDPAAGLPAGRAADWRLTELAHAPITAPTAAEGVVLLAIPDAHQVMALDPRTGKERWRITVDGRVDSPPTLFRGLALFGTRNGWVHAVNRDTGGLVWRFLAAPAQRQLVSNGQPESAWPVFGTVVIHQGLAWFCAGRSTQLDGGLHWYAVEPAAGKVVQSGVLFSKEDWRDPTAKGNSYSRSTLEAPPDTASPLAVTADGRQMLMARAGLDVASGQMLRAGIDYWFPHDTLQAHFAGGPITFKPVGLPSCVLPRRFGLLYNGVDTASLNSVSFYSGVLAKIFAYKDRDFVALLSNVPPANRGGGPNGLRRWQTELIGKQPPSGKEPPAKQIWQAQDYPPGNKDFALHQALVKAGDFILVGYGKKLIVYRYADGQKAAEYDLPAVPVHNGIAVAEGRVIVTCADGSVTCLNGP